MSYIRHHKIKECELDLGDLNLYQHANIDCCYLEDPKTGKLIRGETIVKIIINDSIEWDVTQRISSCTLDDLFNEYIIE